MSVQEGFFTSEHSNSQSFSFYPAPGSARAPLVIYVHGGAWRMGSKDSFKNSENGVHRLRQAFSAAGFACAAINYRLSGEALFPAQIHDVKAAIAYFRTHSAEFSIDPTKIVVVGGSAGGHLSMLAAATGSLGDDYYDDDHSGSVDITCAVSIYGVSDLRTIYDDRVLCGFPRVHPEDDNAEAHLLGSPYPPQSDTSAAENWTKAQPLDFAEKAETQGARRFAPLFLLHGMGDTCVPPVQSARVYDALQARGVETQLALVPEADHADIRCYSDEYLQPMVKWVCAQLSL